MRLLPNQRIRTTHSFQAAFQEGKKVDCRYFFMFLNQAKEPSTNTTKPRVGIIASRKVGGAVKRNYAKRIFRDIFRNNQELIPHNCDIIIVIRSHFNKVPFKELEMFFISTCKRYFHQQ